MTVSCQLSFITLGDVEYNKNIQGAINLIEKSGLDTTVGQMSTLIKGDLHTITALLEALCRTMEEKHFLITMSISNTCGCEMP